MLFILSFTEEGTGMFKATILSLLLTLTGSAFAGWVDIPAPNASSSSGPLNLQFDDASVVRDSGTVSVWFRMQWAGRGTIQQYNSSFDCKNRISNVNDAFQYGPNTPETKYQMPSGPFTPVVPNSASAAVLEHVCAKKWYEVWK